MGCIITTATDSTPNVALSVPGPGPVAPKVTPSVTTPSILSMMTFKPKPENGAKVGTVTEGGKGKRSRIDFQPENEAGHLNPDPAAYIEFLQRANGPVLGHIS